MFGPIDMVDPVVRGAEFFAGILRMLPSPIYGLYQLGFLLSIPPIVKSLIVMFGGGR